MKLKEEEKYIIETIKAARKIQTYLWGKFDSNFGLEEWRRMFRKRVKKIDEIDVTNPYAIIELRKRVLQMGALAVGLLSVLSDGIIPEHKDNEPPSNLSQYKDKL